jgi:hypothetical protein
MASGEAGGHSVGGLDKGGSLSESKREATDFSPNSC